MSNENSKLDAERAAFQAYLDDCREHDIEPSAASAFRFALQAKSLPVGVPEGAIYVEYRQCDQCQHERIVAQLVGGDSVSVPRELLETLMGDNPMDAWDARKELRALLASHAEGGKV